MIGKKLTSEEVLKLEEGTKVWVESQFYNNSGEVLAVGNKEESYGFILEDSYCDFYTDEQLDNLDIYMWEENEDKCVDTHCLTCKNLAKTICEYRSIEKTEKNIYSIIKEFSL